MGGDMCRTIPLAGISVQENGIIRDKEGWIIARLVKEVAFETLLKRTRHKRQKRLVLWLSTLMIQNVFVGST